MTERIAFLAGVCLTSMFLLAACTGGGEGAEPTPAPSPTTVEPSPSPTATPTATAMPTAPSEAPAEPKVVFARGDWIEFRPLGSLWIADLDGSREERLTPEGVRATFAGIVNAKSAPLVYYVVWDSDTERSLWRLHTSTGERELILQFSGRERRLGEASASPGGRYVAFSHAEGIDLLDLASGERSRVVTSSWDPCAVGAGDCYGFSSPRWSADGRLLLVRKGFWEGAITIVVDPFSDPPVEYGYDPYTGGPSAGTWSPYGDAFCGYGRYGAPSGLYMASAPDWQPHNLLPEYEENSFSPEGYSERTVRSCSWLDSSEIIFSVEISEYPGTFPNIPARSTEILLYDIDVSEARFLAAAPASFDVLELIATPEGVILNLFDGSIDFVGDEARVGQPQLVDVADRSLTPILREGDWVVDVVEMLTP